MKEYDEVWAVKTEEIREFFRQLNVSLPLSEEEVSVLPLPDKEMGTLALPQTRVIIKGENAEKIYQEFFLRFMRSGG